MKKQFLILSVVLLAALPAAAQTQQDTVFQKREVIIIDDEQPVVTGETREVIVRDTRKVRVNYRKNGRFKFFNSIGLGYNGLVEGLDNLKLPEDAEWMDLEAKSINFNLMLVQYQYNFGRHFGIQTGVELEVNNFRFSENVTPHRNEAGYVGPNYLDYKLKKSKLVSSYLNVPLVVKVGIGSRNQLEVYGGLVGGWRWNSYTKLKSSEHGKDRNRDNLNLRNFHYGYTAGITFHNVGFYATYYPHSIFKADKGPEVNQVNVGITFKY